MSSSSWKRHFQDQFWSLTPNSTEFLYWSWSLVYVTTCFFYSSLWYQRSPPCASAVWEDIKYLPQLVTIIRSSVKALWLVRGLFIDFSKPNSIAYPSVIFNDNSALSPSSFPINISCKIEVTFRAYNKPRLFNYLQCLDSFCTDVFPSLLNSGFRHKHFAIPNFKLPGSAGVETCRLFIGIRCAYFILLVGVPGWRGVRAFSGLWWASRSYCSQISLLPTADPVLESLQLKVGGNNTGEREQEERTPDLLPGIHFTLAVDEKQEIVISMGAWPVCKAQPDPLRALTTNSLIHIPCLFFL